ncbi:(2Fe-2S)-binding protein [soil metagenome]
MISLLLNSIHTNPDLTMNNNFNLTVNGKIYSLTADPETPLLYILRNNIRLNGPKYGCGREQCGSCMVLLDGKAEPSCLIPVASVREKSVITLEGLIKNGELHPVQKAFVQEQAAQCGYCLNGMVITAVSLLNENNNPDEQFVKEKMERVLCRCGSQPRVLKAIEYAKENLNP